MSILVPNSFFFLDTLPESCYVCPFIHNGCKLLQEYMKEHDGCIPPYHYTEWHLWNPEDKGRVHGCQLIEIPAHGDLIDRGDLLKRLHEKWVADDPMAATFISDILSGLVLPIIENAPTVISAEPYKEKGE